MLLSSNFFCNLRLCTQVDDQLAGASLGAGTAVDALAVIDRSQIVFHSDGTGGALSGAQSTADTADGALLTYILTLGLGCAAHEDLLISGSGFNQLTGASCLTSAAVDALFNIDNGLAVYDMNGIELTDLDTGAQTEATKAAGEGAAGNLRGSQTVADALVVELLLGLVTAAAVNVSNHTSTGLSLNAHNLTDLSSASSATNGASIDLSIAGNDLAGAVGATGIAAAAAVCAGQNGYDLFDALILLNVEDLRGKGQQAAEQSTQSAQNDNGKNYIFHSLPP